MDSTINNINEIGISNIKDEFKIIKDLNSLYKELKEYHEKKNSNIDMGIINKTLDQLDYLNRYDSYNDIKIILFKIFKYVVDELQNNKSLDQRTNKELSEKYIKARFIVKDFYINNITYNDIIVNNRCISITESIELLNKYKKFNLYKNKNLEELLCDIVNSDERLAIERSFINYGESKENEINILEYNLKHYENDKRNIILNMEKCEEVIFLFSGIKNDIVNKCEDLYVNFYEKLLTLIENEEIPNVRESYYYLSSRLGKVKDEVDPNINKIYRNNTTILHNELLKYNEFNYTKVNVSLIKMGSNITLKDKEGKTPLRCISEERLNGIYNNLVYRTMIHWNLNRLVGLRVYRAILEIEYMRNNLGKLNRYFEGLKNFILHNNEANMERLKPHFGLLIYHEENLYIKNEMKSYVQNLIEENDRKIEEALCYFKSLNLDENGNMKSGSKYTPKNRMEKEKYNNYMEDMTKACRENQLIRKYLQEDAYDEFVKIKDKIKIYLSYLEENCLSDNVNEILIFKVKQFLYEFPTQIYMNICENEGIFEKLVEIKCIELIKVCVKLGRNINDYFEFSNKLPLEKAIEYGDYDFVEELLQLNVDLDKFIYSKEKNGKQLIKDTGDPELIKYLGEVELKDLVIYTSRFTHYSIDNVSTAVSKFTNNDNNEIIKNSNIENSLRGSKEILNSNAVDVFNNNEYISGIIDDNEKKEINRINLIFTEALNYFINENISSLKDLMEGQENIYKWHSGEGLNFLTYIMIFSVSDKQKNFYYECLLNNSKDLNTVTINKFNNPPLLHFIIEKIRRDIDRNKNRIVNHPLWMIHSNYIDILHNTLKYIDNIELLNNKDIYGKTAIDYAVTFNMLNEVKELFSKYLELCKSNENQDFKIENILHLQYAVLMEHFNSDEYKKMKEMILDLLKKYDMENYFKNILNDTSFEYHQSILHIALSHKKTNLVTVLIGENGIDLNIQNSMGRTPIHYSIFYDNMVVFNKLKQDKNKNLLKIVLETVDNIYLATPLHYAIATHNKDTSKMIQFLIQNYSDIFDDLLDKKDVNGRTILHYSTIFKINEVINILIDYDKINVNIKDYISKKPIDYLLKNEIDNNSEKIIRNILNKSGEINDDEILNLLQSAFENIVNPDKGKDLILKILNLNLKNYIDNILEMDIVYSNTKISSEFLCEIIKMGVNNDDKKSKVLMKLVKYKRGDISEKVGLKNDYIKLLNEESINIIFKKFTESNNVKSNNCNNSMDYSTIIKDQKEFKSFFDKFSPEDKNKFKNYVIENNDFDKLKLFINYGIDFNNKELCKKATEEAIMLLLEFYYNNKILEEQIKKATKDGNKSLLTTYFNSNYPKTEGLLHIAVEKDSVSLLKFIIDNCGEEIIKEKNEYNESVYDVAFSLRKRNSIIYLIMRDPLITQDPNITSINNSINTNNNLLNTNFKLYKDVNKEKTIEVKENIKQSIIKAKILKYDIKGFENILKTNFKNKINNQDYLGNTLLYYAVTKCKEKAISLINKGANINIKNKEGESPFSQAIKYGDKDLVNYMIIKGGNINDKVKGKTLLHYAMKRVINENGEKIKEIKTKNSIALYLINNGIIDLSPKTINELIRVDGVFRYTMRTQLMIQIDKNHENNSKLLIKSNDIDLNVKDSEGLTAIIYAKKYPRLLQKLESLFVYHENKVRKNIFGLTDSTTAIQFISGGILSALGIMKGSSLKLNFGYNLIEFAINKGKDIPKCSNIFNNVNNYRDIINNSINIIGKAYKDAKEIVDINNTISEKIKDKKNENENKDNSEGKNDNKNEKNYNDNNIENMKEVNNSNIENTDNNCVEKNAII